MKHPFCCNIIVSNSVWPGTREMSWARSPVRCRTDCQTIRMARYSGNALGQVTCQMQDMLSDNPHGQALRKCPGPGHLSDAGHGVRQSAWPGTQGMSWARSPVRCRISVGNVMLICPLHFLYIHKCTKFHFSSCVENSIIG